ncbi:MAG: BMP family ABC transporter substrate-binding protein, partial [Butyricicoccus sp.]|nr:BMP family ABC transporter substrate-binding protein [Butyricicoccus sp.]
MKRLFSMLLAGVLACSMLAGCGGEKTPAASGSEVQGSGSAVQGGDEGIFPAVAKDDLKVGVIHITDPAEGSGYTYT